MQLDTIISSFVAFLCSESKLVYRFLDSLLGHRLWFGKRHAHSVVQFYIRGRDWMRLDELCDLSNTKLVVHTGNSLLRLPSSVRQLCDEEGAIGFGCLGHLGEGSSFLL